MTETTLTRFLAILTVVCAIGFVVEHRRVSQFKAELRTLEARTSTSFEVLTDTLHSQRETIDNIVNYQSTVRAETARLSLLRRAERPATRSDFQAVANRIDLMERIYRPFLKSQVAVQ